MQDENSNGKPNEKVSVSVVMSADLLAVADARAQRLDLTRSQYLRALVRKDLEQTSHVEQSQPEKVAA